MFASYKDSDGLADRKDLHGGMSQGTSRASQIVLALFPTYRGGNCQNIINFEGFDHVNLRS